LDTRALDAKDIDYPISDLFEIAFGAGGSPYEWQRRIVLNWPDVLIAPTGSGKTAGVTLGWAARRILDPVATPRRLVWCLPMRTLVEQTVKAIQKWFDRLSSIIQSEGILPSQQDIHVLMGGVESAGWLDNPERASVIVGTQDMLLSRALMRGYASSRAVWPMEFACLHQDVQWVYDEVQLMGAGRATSAQLEAFRRIEQARARKRGLSNTHPSHSLWISATLRPGWLQTVDFPAPTSLLEVCPDANSDSRLATLATAPKRLRRSSVAPVSQKVKDAAAYCSDLAEAIVRAHRSGRMTLVVVNQVARAQNVYKALEQMVRKREKPGLRLALVHSRFRRPDRQQQTKEVIDGNGRDLIVIATQAIEAGVDVSSAVMISEIAPWPSMVQRFGRANRYAELDEGADVYWVDLLSEVGADGKPAEALARPYSPNELDAARERLNQLYDVAPACLPEPDDPEPPLRVIRERDLYDLFDTDPDLTGFDVDISPYVRDADDTDIRVFWRDLTKEPSAHPPRPHAAEFSAVPVGLANTWISKVQKVEKKCGKTFVYVRDPQWTRRNDQPSVGPAGWVPFRGNVWPGLTLLVDFRAGGYSETYGFTGNLEDRPAPIGDSDHESVLDSTADDNANYQGGDTEGHDEDPRSSIGVPTLLSTHLRNAASEARALCDSLNVGTDISAAITRAAYWHDLGKAHEVFQDTMRRGLNGQCQVPDDALLAKTTKHSLRHKRAYFRHELASALALLAHDNWSRDANLVAYLIAAHHGKVRMNLRPLPKEREPRNLERPVQRFARGIWEGDVLPPFDLGGAETWRGGQLTLAVMEMGWDQVTKESWAERTRDLLARYGPFHLAWLETLLRLADWRASAKESTARDSCPK